MHGLYYAVLLLIKGRYPMRLIDRVILSSGTFRFPFVVNLSIFVTNYS